MIAPGGCRYPPLGGGEPGGYRMCLALLLPSSAFGTGAWTTLSRTEHASGIPERTTSPQISFDLTRRDGATLLTGVDTATAVGPQAAAEAIFGDVALAIQARMHVGTNNFGFRGGVPITNLDVRPPHVDTIANVFGVDEAPDYFLLCSRVTSSDGGGASYLTDIPAAIQRMPEPHRTRLPSLEIVQTIKLIAGFDELATNRSNATQGQSTAAGQALSAASVLHRVERMVLPNTRDAHHACFRYSSWADSLLSDDGAAADDENAPIRPTPSSADPRLDMQTVAAYLRAVKAETDEAARFLLQPGDCAVIDNYRAAHGREPYGDLGRALWQVWVWSNASLAVPDNPGPACRWVRHPRVPTPQKDADGPDGPAQQAKASPASPASPEASPLEACQAEERTDAPTRRHDARGSGALVPPTVDLSPFMADEGVVLDGADPTAAQMDAAKAIHESYTSHGFLHVLNFGLDESLLRRAFDVSSRLFAMPTEVKMTSLARISPASNVGYAPLALEKANHSRPPDLREMFNVRNPREHTNRFDGTPEGTEAVALELWRVLERAARRFSLALALALGLERDYFARSMDKMDLCACRFNHYPPIPDGEPSRPREPGPLRIGEHTDFAAFTFLLLEPSHGALGLQVRPGSVASDVGPYGDGWVDVVVPPSPPASVGAIVNTGQQLPYWTNDLWKATSHRVVAADAEAARADRYSIACFYDADKAALVNVDPRFVPEGEQPHYPPTTGLEYLLRKLARAQGATAELGGRREVYDHDIGVRRDPAIRPPKDLAKEA